MRKFASVSVLAAMALTCAFAVTPAASAAPPRPGPAPAFRALRHVQPGGPIALTRGRPSFGSKLGSTQDIVSQNWGGYAALRSGTRFRFIRATFFVPYVNCTNTPDTFSAHWVGLDGLTDATVEQDGILAVCNGPVPEYAAWYEMFPQDPVYPSMAIQPGDSISASVYYSSAAGTFTLALTDTTNGAHFSVTKTCPSGSSCGHASAEAISEAPASSSSILPLTDFAAESYSSVRVTDQSGQRGGLRGAHWGTIAITTANASNTVLDQPTQIYRGEAFDMYWMAQS